MAEKYNKKQGWNEVNRPKESKEYLQARNIAGLQIQNNFSSKSNSAESHWSQDFHWIKAELTSPSFDDLTFGYKNKVFSVLIDFVRPVRHILRQMTVESLLPQDRIEQFLTTAKENNLVPCLFPIYRDGLKPMTIGWNLLHAKTHEWLQPEKMATNERTPLSKWELNNFAIQVVRQYIEDNGDKICSFCDMIGIEPQIWFENKKGERCWVVVKQIDDATDNDYHKWLGLENVSTTIKKHDGFFAGVEFRNANDFGTTLYRGEGAIPKFEGLRRVFVTDNPMIFKREHTQTVQPIPSKLKHVFMLIVLQMDKFTYIERDHLFAWKEGKLYCTMDSNGGYAMVFMWMRHLAKADSVSFENILSLSMIDNTSAALESMAISQESMIKDFQMNFPNFNPYVDVGNFSSFAKDMQKNLISWMYVDNKSLSSMIKSFGGRMQKEIETSFSKFGTIFSRKTISKPQSISCMEDAYQLLLYDWNNGNININRKN